MTLKDEALTEAQGLFKAMNLSQAQAQQLVDFHTKAAQQIADAGQKAYDDMRKGWRDEVAADKDLGPNIEKVRVATARAIDSIGDAKLAGEFRAAMDLTGAGDNPAFIKVFYALAQRVTEGGHISGKGPSAHGQQRPGAPQDAAHAMYPNLT